MSSIVDGLVVTTNTTKSAKGGTELMRSRLLNVVNKEKVYRYVYKIECNVTGNYYIGQRTYRGKDVEKDSYMGSGNWIKILKNKFPDRYCRLEKTIIEYVENKEELRRCEQKYINLFYNDPKCKNMSKDSVNSCDYKSNIRFDRTLYRFVNFNLMKIIISTQYDMSIKYSIPKTSISSLIKGRSSYIKGWVYLGVWGEYNISLQEAYTKFKSSGKKGYKNIKYNHTIYNWYNPEKDKIIKSTCHGMKKHTSTNINFSKALKYRNISLAGYYLLSDLTIPEIKELHCIKKYSGFNNPNSDKTRYVFMNGNELFEGNRYEFIKFINDESTYSQKYIGDLINGRQKTYKGWRIL